MKRYVKKSYGPVRASRMIKASSGMSVDEMWDYLLEAVGVSEETLRVVTDINGYSEQTMCDILYSVTGYRDFDQLDWE